jgi:hypothetical protein
MKRVALTLLAITFILGSVTAMAQTQAQPQQPLTKEQIVDRVGVIDRQLLILEKQELVKQYQALEAKEAASKPKTDDKKDKK